MSTAREAIGTRAPAPPVVTFENVTKRLRRGVVAVDGLDLVVEHGQVVGLTGPNGSGKSVALKMLLGLVRPSSGRITLFGEPVRPGGATLAKVGTLIDGPGFVPHLSGYDNLRLVWRLTPRTGRDVDSVAHQSGLGDAVHRAYSTYSHGMRYRLALARALLGDPELLVLDEPTTGLDPLHIREVRAAVTELNRRGTTVLLASHLLSEVEQICTHAAVMQQGRLIASGSIPDLVESATSVTFDVADVQGGITALSGHPEVTVIRDGESLVVQGAGVDPQRLMDVLRAADVGVLGFRLGRPLESVYAALVAARTPERTAASSG